MTTDEAAKVAGVALDADGGCSHCAGELIRQLMKLFPEHADVFEGAFEREFGWPLGV